MSIKIFGNIASNKSYIQKLGRIIRRICMRDMLVALALFMCANIFLEQPVVLGMTSYIIDDKPIDITDNNNNKWVFGHDKRMKK